MILDLHHVQLAMPMGGEAQAQEFYGGVLGMTRVPKPDALATRGGLWFVAGHVQVHLGIMTPFLAATKAHPAFRVASLARAIERLTAADLVFARDFDLPGLRRIFVADPFGNRIELLEQDDSGAGQP